MGIDYNIVPGHGPVIAQPIRSQYDLSRLIPLTHIDSQVPFLKPLLQVKRPTYMPPYHHPCLSSMSRYNCSQTLRQEIANKSTLIGFVGAPWTLTAYSVEGQQSKACGNMKAMMLGADTGGVLLPLLEHITESICRYAEYQVTAYAS